MPLSISAGRPLNLAGVGAHSFAFRDDGVFVQGGSSIYLARPPFPGVGSGAHAIPSADGSQVYVFDPAGRHLETRNALTNQRLWGFEYDTSGRLSGMRNGHDQLTVIERDSAGSPRAIVGPHGQRTVLTVNSDGLLASIERPGAERHELQYDDGLLVRFEDPTRAASTMVYDDEGRIEVDRDRLSNSLSFSREDEGRAWSVTRASPLGFESTFEVERRYDGGLTRTSEFPDGTFVLTDRSIEGSTDITRSDGTAVSSVRDTDPRWGMATPLFSTTTTLPSGLSQSVQRTRAVALTNPAVPSTLTSQVDTTRINTLSYTDTYTASDRRTVSRTPVGRQTETWADLFGRTIRSRGPLGPNVHTQFAQDRLTAVIIDPDNTLGNGNERTTSMTYDALGRLETVRDPRNSVTSFTDYDPADRPHTIVLPDSSAVNMSYDVEGNVSSVTPPGKEPHLMSYGMWGRIESYEPPVGNRVEYFYDADRRMELIDFGTAAGAGEQIVDFVYDPDTSLLDTITSPRGTIDVGYTEGRMTSLVAPSLSGPITTNLAYDGHLPTTVSWSGPVAGSVSWTYNNRFLVASETVGALPATTVTYGYDNDGLVTSAGALAITRDGAGRVLTKTVGRIRETLAYTAYGELARQTVAHLNTNGTVRETLYDAIYVAGTGASAQGTRDALGRITRKTESIISTDLPEAAARALETRRYDYGYNPEGRPWLESVSVDGTVVSSYGYDQNGNRTSAELNWSTQGYDPTFDQSLSETDTEYNAADQIQRYGDTEYAWNAVGQLQSKRNTATGDETSYEYDLFGNLLSVVLPDGRTVEYEVDGAGRRVGRRLLSESGTELEYKGWIYRDLLRPIAEVDSTGNVVARYVYDDGAGSKQNGAHQLATRLGANQDTSLPFEGDNVPEFIELLSGGTVTARYRLIKNQVGTVLAVVDATTGEVAQRMEYDEFGRVLFDSSPGLQPFGFAGGLYDAESALVRFGARDYEATTGRWMARDPVRFGAGDGNLYSFVGQEPTNRIDPNGLFCSYWRAEQIYGDAMRDAENSPFNTGSGHNDNEDAYRHCLASCRMTQECGAASAAFYGMANEAWGSINGQPDGEGRMDNKNA